MVLPIWLVFAALTSAQSIGSLSQQPSATIVPSTLSSEPSLSLPPSPSNAPSISGQLPSISQPAQPSAPESVEPSASQPEQPSASEPVQPSASEPVPSEPGTPPSPTGPIVSSTPPAFPENGSFAFQPFPSPAPFGRSYKEFDPSQPPPVENDGTPGTVPSFARAWSNAWTKAQKFVSGLTLEEKVNVTTGVGWMNGRCVGNTPPVKDFPGFCLEDAPLGVRLADFVTAFPSGINAAATWNKRLIRTRGLYMGREFVGKGVNVALGPMMNMGRVPRGGRNYEGFGADPYLTGESAYETILGMQQAGVQACAKHFINNEQEFKRTLSSSEVSDRAQHEIYAHPFLRSVMAGVASFMCSYNLINGTYACENDKMQNDILKREFGFRGFMMSDWQATMSTVSSIAGLDMTMPGDIVFNSGDSYFGGNLTIYVNNNTIPVSRVDDMATRIIASWYLLKQDSPKYPKTNFDAFKPDSWETNDHVDVQYSTENGKEVDHSTLVREMGAASVVLLKNNNNALPLKKPRSLVMVGSDAGPAHIGPNTFGDQGGTDGILAMGWGSGTTNFTYLISPYEAIQRRAREDRTSVSWSFDDYNTDRAGNVVIGKSAALVFVKADSGEQYITVDGNSGDRKNLTLWNNGEALIPAVAAQNNNTIVIVHSTGPVIVEGWIDHPNITAVLWAGVSGTETGNAITDVLYGKWNPSGRLPYTIAKRPEDYGADIVTGGGDQDIIAVPYTDELLIDYRHFDAKNIEPRFEFGFGLSYTTFKYSNIRISKASQSSSSTSDEKAWDRGQATAMVVGSSTAGWLHRPIYQVQFDVVNAGNSYGGDIPQLYVHFPAAEGEPPSVLRGFTNVELKKGQRSRLILNLSRYDLSIWDTQKQGWRRPKGTINISVGTSSRKLLLKGSIPNSV